MNLDSLAVLVNTLLGVIVLWSCICAANHMSMSTPWAIRCAYVFLGVGAAAALLAPGYLHRTPTVAELFLVAGTALLSVTDRRRYARRLSGGQAARRPAD